MLAASFMLVSRGACPRARQKKGERARHPGACPFHKGRGAVRNFYLSLSGQYSKSFLRLPSQSRRLGGLTQIHSPVLETKSLNLVHRQGSAPSEVSGGGDCRASSGCWCGRHAIPWFVDTSRPPASVLTTFSLCVSISASLLLRTPVKLD